MQQDSRLRSELTDSQLGMYLECVDETNPSCYLLPVTFRFPADRIDAARLAAAFDTVARTYSAFSTVIFTENAQPYMRQTEEALPPLAVAEIGDDAVEARKAELCRPFAFDGTLLWRGEVLKTPTQILLLLVIHHTVFDGSSVAVLNRALAAAYDGTELPPESITMAEAKRLETAVSESPAAQEARRYFDDYLGGLETDSVPLPDKAGQEVPATAVAEYDFSADTAMLTAFAKTNGVTENTVFLSAFAYALGKFNNQNEVVFTSVESGRHSGGYDTSMGMFVKSFPLRFQWDEQYRAEEWVHGVREHFFATLKHNHLAFSELAKQYVGCADVKYIYQGDMFRGFPVNGTVPEVHALGATEVASRWDVMVYKVNGAYRLWLGYQSHRYTREMMDCFAALYDTVLGELIQGKRLCDIELTSPDDRARQERNNQTALAFDRTLTVDRIFEETASRFPDKAAVSYGETVLNYADLSRLSGKVAAYLQRRGIGAEQFVPILIPRNEYMAVCALGVLRAGAAYQPLDPTYPEERLNFMLTDSGASLLIADRSLVSLVSDFHGEVLYTDEIDALPGAEGLSVEVRPDAAALLIYTSGTTGVPKGCILENRNLVAFYFSHRRNVELSEQAKVATIASFGFDAAAMDIFTTLMAGGELCIVPEEIKLDIPQVEQFYQEHGITNGFMTTQLGRMFLEQTRCKTLRHFVLGGEKLVPFTPPEWIACHNFYGPSESIAYICGYTIRDNGPIQPIGKPCGNTKLYLTDAQNRLLPTGCSGELCIAGLQVGRGYHHRPEKTAEAFVPNPFCTESGYEMLYKTGDIVRRLPDGNYDFIGRRDGQVKIRGFRVELTEIEQVIREFDGITNATVQAYDDAGAGKFVAAFIVSEHTVDIDALNAFIGERKPPYMIPAVTVQLEAIPVNANGKVDRRRLPKPERKFEAVTKPQTAVQQAIYDCVAEITGTAEFGIDTDLYLVGLSSIGSIRLCSALAERFAVTVQMKDIRQNTTVRKLESFVATASGETAYAVLDDYPLTKTQEGIFAECFAKPDSTRYNIPLVLRLSPNINTDRLKAAIVATVEAHPYLKTELFTDDSGAVRQRRSDTSPFNETDIETVTHFREADLLAAVTPFSLLNTRLFRFKLFCGDALYLFFEIHHIIADGTSVNRIVKDLETAYAGTPLAKETYTSFEVALDEEKRRQTTAFDDAKAYFGTLLDELDMNFLPGDDRLPTAVKDSGKLPMQQQKADAARVAAFCEEHRISINGLLCAAFGLVLAKYAGMDYAVFNTVYSGRNDSRAANTVGMLVKTLPVVCRTDKEQAVDIAREVTAQLIDSMANDLYSFAEICKEYGVKNDIVFVYQGDSFNFDSFGGEPAAKLDIDLSESKAPLTVEVAVKDGQFRYTAEYDPERYTQALIRTVLSALDTVIASFTENEAVSRISLLTEEVAQKLDEYNQTETDYDCSRTIADYYREQTRQHPDKPCVVYRDTTYTYREAFDLSCRLAAFLRSRGIGKDDIVSILIPRNECMVLCAHGVILAGAAYLGIDPTYPRERIRFMLEDSGTRVLIVDRSLRELAEGFDGEIVFTDSMAALPEVPSDFADNLNHITPDSTALVIYSSGTTGVPKGALLRHSNIVCFYQNYARDMDLGTHSRTAMYASFGFDGGAMDVFCSPMAGATLYIIPDDIRMDMEKLEQFYVQNRITNGFMTTQVGCLFIGHTRCQTLTHFLVGGEKLIPTVPPPGVTFYNGYGPSETMCYVNAYRATDTGALQPIGKVNRNMKEYLVDRFGNRLPFGACGELCIAGGQTGYGYLNRPEKTAASFVKNPFCDQPPYDRLYKTGDIVRQLPDGNFVFVGRRDGQVKIRGFRIELTEVEQIIRQYPGIRNTVVQAFDNPAGGQYLAAYIVGDGAIDIAALHAFIASEKPDYMVPAVTVQIDEIPLTANGKVDKRKLPPPTPTVTKKGAEPANETEEALCGIFAEVLGLPKVYADDDFFAVGGSSISAIKVVVKCNNAGYDIVFKNLFANPTPHALSEYLQGCRGDEVYAPDESEAETYDYSALRYNTVEHVAEIRHGDIGDVLLTGVTGFLGSHILKELLDNTASHVFCLVRGKDGMDAETRFRMMMTYYFEDWYTDAFSRRVTVIDGELGSQETMDQIRQFRFDTLINSAANVKHFAAGDELLKDNFSGVENLIRLAEETHTLLVQISSTSVSGEAVSGKVEDDFRFCEYHLNIGQSLENKYIYSKYQAEQAVIDAISRGRIRGKIIRLGNLMARFNDSEFQINAGSNGFLKQFYGYKKLAMFPVTMMDKEIEFSPIDSVAKAVVLLSGTPDPFTVFHAKNCNAIHYGYLINAMRQKGIDIQIVEDSVFAERYRNALKNEAVLSDFSSLIAYRDNDAGDGRDRTLHQIESDATFTTKALYRLGFAWPLVSKEYLENMVKVLMELGFFTT